MLSAAHRRNAGGSNPGPVPSIAGCQLWLDAGQLTGLSNNDPLSTWTDFSTHGHNATQSGSARPTYKTNVQNGIPAILFAAASTQFVTGALTLSQPMTLFAVVKHLNTGHTYEFYLDCDTNRVAFLRLDQAAPGFEVYAGSDGFTTVAQDTNWHYLTGVVNGSSSIVTVDGSATTGLTAGSNSLGPNFFIGASNAVISGRAPMDGYIGEFIIYDTALSSGDRVLVQNYLKSKWGL